MEKNVLLDTIRAFGGQPKIITIPRPFVDFAGTLEAGMMLNQLIYWSERDGGRGRIYKSDKDWSDELCLSKYAVRQAREHLEEMGILRTEVHRANGVPTVHYYLLEDALVEKWTLWIRKIEIAKTQNQTLRNDKIPNRDYAEITPEITIPPTAEISSSPDQPDTPAQPVDITASKESSVFGTIEYSSPDEKELALNPDRGAVVKSVTMSTAPVPTTAPPSASLAPTRVAPIMDTRSPKELVWTTKIQIALATGEDPNLNNGKHLRVAKLLVDGGYKPEDVERLFCGTDAPWYKTFPGRQSNGTLQKPTIANINSSIANLKRGGNGKALADPNLGLCAKKLADIMKHVTPSESDAAEAVKILAKGYDVDWLRSKLQYCAKNKIFPSVHFIGKWLDDEHASKGYTAKATQTAREKEAEFERRYKLNHPGEG